MAINNTYMPGGPGGMPNRTSFAPGNPLANVNPNAGLQYNPNIANGGGSSAPLNLSGVGQTNTNPNNIGNQSVNLNTNPLATPGANIPYINPYDPAALTNAGLNITNNPSTVTPQNVTAPYGSSSAPQSAAPTAPTDNQYGSSTPGWQPDWMYGGQWGNPGPQPNGGSIQPGQITNNMSPLQQAQVQNEAAAGMYGPNAPNANNDGAAYMYGPQGNQNLFSNILNGTQQQFQQQQQGGSPLGQVSPQTAQLLAQFLQMLGGNMNGIGQGSGVPNQIFSSGGGQNGMSGIAQLLNTLQGMQQQLGLGPQTSQAPQMSNPFNQLGGYQYPSFP
jgi:hypothetical protein